MGALNRHWTERDVNSFIYRIGADFVRQLQKKMESGQISQAALAGALKVSEGRVSQVLNNPGNLTLRKIVQYARALNQKVSVVAYDDGDPQNQNGPINSEIFESCWRRAGRPRDFFALSKPPLMLNHAIDVRQQPVMFWSYAAIDVSVDRQQSAGNTSAFMRVTDYDTDESSTTVKRRHVN